jgi:hypothetical protein
MYACREIEEAKWLLVLHGVALVSSVFGGLKKESFKLIVISV